MIGSVLPKGTLALADVFPDFFLKIPEKTLHRFCRPWGKGAIGMAHVSGHFSKHGNELLPALAVLNSP